MRSPKKAISIAPLARRAKPSALLRKMPKLTARLAASLTLRACSMLPPPSFTAPLPWIRIAPTCATNSALSSLRNPPMPRPPPSSAKPSVFSPIPLRLTFTSACCCISRSSSHKPRMSFAPLPGSRRAIPKRISTWPKLFRPPVPMATPFANCKPAWLSSPVTPPPGTPSVCCFKEPGTWKPPRPRFEISPQDATLHYDLGLTLKLKDQLPAAIAEFQKAIELDPNQADAHYTLGVTFWQQGNFGPAADELRSAIRVRPDYAEAHYTLGT